MIDHSHGLMDILVADDDPPTRLLLRATLAQWGYIVREAGDGLEAFEQLLKPDPPMLVVVDWMMPKLDGIGFCQRVKNELETPPYIILLTSFTGTTQIIKALDAGADEFLSKPFNPGELHSRLRAGSRILAFERAGKKAQGSSPILPDHTLKSLLELNTQFQKSLENLNKKLFSKNFLDKVQRQALTDDLRDLTRVQENLSKTIDLITKTKE